MTVKTTPGYRPMRNDPAGFDPVAGPWAYVLDGCTPYTWRELVARGERRQAWPFARAFRFQAIKLEPDWCNYSWHPHAVLAWPGWDESRDAADTEMHQVTARMWFEHRNAGGTGLVTWTGTVRLDLRTREWTWHPCVADRDKPMPAAITAELEARVTRLLAFLDDAIEHWRTGDQPRPVTASDLYHQLKGPQS